MEENITVETPAGLESTADHKRILEKMSIKKAKVVRKDGNPEAAFKKAVTIIERSYTCPFLAHNTMEPMNFYADVTEEKATLVGPISKLQKLWNKVFPNVWGCR